MLSSPVWCKVTKKSKPHLLTDPRDWPLAQHEFFLRRIADNKALVAQMMSHFGKAEEFLAHPKSHWLRVVSRLEEEITTLEAQDREILLTAQKRMLLANDARIDDRSERSSWRAKSGKPSSGPPIAHPKATKTPYRSKVKRFIQSYLLSTPDATDREICERLDEDGGCELPEWWKTNPNDRSFDDAYLKSRTKNRIQAMISKIRKDLRDVRAIR